MCWIRDLYLCLPLVQQIRPTPRSGCANGHEVTLETFSCNRQRLGIHAPTQQIEILKKWPNVVQFYKYLIFCKLSVNIADENNY